MLSGVAPFAIEQGLVAAQDGETTVRVYNVNTRSRIDVVVLTPGGRVPYDGDCRIAGVADPALVVYNGMPVVGEGGTVNIPPGTRVSIGADGTVTAQAGSGPAQVVGRLKLVNPPPGELRKGADGLMRTTSGDPAEADPAVRVSSGALEGSNVNVVESMVGMIAAARQYEVQMQLLRNAEQNDQHAAQLLCQR